MGPVLLFMGHPGAVVTLYVPYVCLWFSKTCKFFSHCDSYICTIWRTGSYIFLLLYIFLLCDEVLLPWNFAGSVYEELVVIFYVPPGMTGGTLCFRVVRRSVRPSRFRGTTLRAAPSKSYAFQQIIMHPLQCQHDLYVRILFCVDLWPPYNRLPRLCLT